MLKFILIILRLAIGQNLMLDGKRLSLKCYGVNSAVYINDSLCRYYKNLWVKCKKLWLNKFIHGFWDFQWV